MFSCTLIEMTCATGRFSGAYLVCWYLCDPLVLTLHCLLVLIWHVSAYVALRCLCGLLVLMYEPLVLIWRVGTYWSVGTYMVRWYF